MTPYHRPEPRLEPVETCWRMRSLQKATRILSCGIYRTDAGLEVRCEYEPDDLLRSQTAPEIGTARDAAEQWRQAVLAKDAFRET
jgi:hypothetical protein